MPQEIPLPLGQLIDVVVDSPFRTAQLHAADAAHFSIVQPENWPLGSIEYTHE